MEQRLINLYKSYTGTTPDLVLPVTIQGSGRRYYRLIKNNQSIIGTMGETVAENELFFALSNALHKAGINVPRVVAVSSDRQIYLQTDLGNTSLFDLIKEGRETGVFDTTQIDLLVSAISCLPQIQFKGGDCARTANINLPAFNERTINWDLNYFKYSYLKVTDIKFDESDLQDDFERMTNELLSCSTNDTLLYRDFQSRNIIIDKHGHPGFIDYQSARFGPIYYDVASMLWQARAHFTDEVREKLIDTYISSASEYIHIDRDEFWRNLSLFVLFRQLQTLGAYGYRGLIQHKAHFKDSLRPAIKAVNRHLDCYPRLSDNYPTITKALKSVAPKSDNKSFIHDNVRINDSKLTVTVGSFSYKKGLPIDPTGNGGGYIFDCRGMHNPGRYDEYKSLTGKDRPVIEFLEERGEVQQYVDNAIRIVSHHIDTYIRRGFTSLQIWFGCTGGQHRSVYCASSLAKRIMDIYNDKINVQLIHREQPHLQP